MLLRDWDFYVHCFAEGTMKNHILCTNLNSVPHIAVVICQFVVAVSDFTG